MDLLSFVTVYVVASSVAMIAAALAGLRIALQRAGWEDSRRRRAFNLAAVILIGWFAAAVAVSAAGMYEGTLDRLPTIQYGIFVPILIGIFAYWRSPFVRDVVAAVPQSWIVGFQVYRVLGGIFLVLAAGGLMPAAFGLPAGGGDVLVGLAALPVAVAWHRGAEHRSALVRGWNVAGLGDLAIALGTGFLTSPSALQMLAFDAPNTLISAYPLALIPVFLVPLSILLHFASLAKLAQETRDTAIHA